MVEKKKRMAYAGFNYLLWFIPVGRIALLTVEEYSKQLLDNKYLP